MITREELATHVLIDPETGRIRWINPFGRGKKREDAGFIKPGDQSNGGGYKIICINRKRLRAHHIIWFWQTGRWPIGEIDHINGDRSDNRFCNLRETTISENRQNRRIQSNNKCGLKWVSYHPQSGKWRAEVKRGGKRVHDSLHSTPNDAYLAACNAAKVAHGEFFNPGR